MEHVARAWKDPVWSKVISAAIIGLIVKLYDRVATVQLPSWLTWTCAAVALALVVSAAVTSILRKRLAVSKDTAPVDFGGMVYQIEIHADEGLPYHELTSEAGHVLSTVRVGIKNSGEKILSNCKVYVDKISPPANPLVQNAILLADAAFNLRPDDPEQLVDIAAHWDHASEFRFSAPVTGTFYEAMQYMDSEIKRTFVIRVRAREFERSALFDIWADASKRLHLKFLNYTD